MNKPINLDKPKSFDYLKKRSAIASSKRTPIVPEEIRFLIPFNPLSFRTKDKKSKKLLEEATKKQLKKIPKNKIDKLYNKKIYLGLEFHCRPEKLNKTDTDNMEKLISDILQKCGVFRNDSQIRYTNCYKRGISKDSKGSIVVILGELIATRYQGFV